MVEQPENEQPEQAAEVRPEAVDEVLGHLRAAQDGVRSVGDILRDALAADDALMAEAANGSADGAGATGPAGDASDASGQAR